MDGRNHINKKLIICGSEGLIGKVLTKHFVNQGSNVIRVDKILGHHLEDESFVEQFFEENADASSLINLFALNPQPEDISPDLLDTSLKSLREYLEINLVTLFSVCREYSRRAKAGSSVVNFSSIYGVRPPKHFIYTEGFTKHIGYAISKAGVISLTQFFATRLAPKIRFNVVVPGGVEHDQPEDFERRYSAMTPAGRMMRGEELAGAVEYLIDDQSTYTTGSVLTVDGGWSAW